MSVALCGVRLLGMRCAREDAHPPPHHWIGKDDGSEIRALTSAQKTEELLDTIRRVEAGDETLEYLAESIRVFLLP